MADEPANAEDHAWGVGRTECEQAIPKRLRDLSNGRSLFDVWTFFDRLVVTVCVIDTGVLRTLRVDFDGTSLTAGNDPGHQITEADLDPEDPDYLRVQGPLGPRELADRAYDWFRREASRPIDRQEWDGDDHGWRLWVLADVNRLLSAQYTGCPDRPPDRVIRLDPPVL